MGTVKAHRPVVGIEEVTLAIACNQCGKAAPFDDHMARANFHLFEASGGYGTDFPGDCVQMEFALCSACLVKLSEGFKIKAPLSGGIGGGIPAFQAFHTEREEMVTVDAGWAHTQANPRREWTKETNDEYQEWHRKEGAEWSSLMHGEDPDSGEGGVKDWPVASTMYRHFKGNLYEILYPNNWMGVFDAETKEPLVIYRALYEDSKVFARPLSMWNDQMDQGDGEYKGPRFRPVTTDSL